jgi:hypothetical protein
MNRACLSLLLLGVAFPAYGALTDNLESYWTMDEGSGNAADSVGGRTMTDNNTVANAAGKVNSARDLESGSSEYFSHAGWTWYAAYSIQMWVKPESMTSADNYVGLFCRGDAASMASLLLKSNGKLAYYADIGSYDGTGATTLTNGNWFHIVVTYSAGTGIIVYVNDAVDVDTADSGAPSTTARQTQIGFDHQVGTRLFDGVVDEVGVWSRVLSAAEVTELYNAGAGVDLFPDPATTATQVIIVH